MSVKNRENARKNVHPHYGGRGGYILTAQHFREYMARIMQDASYLDESHEFYRGEIWTFMHTPHRPGVEPSQDTQAVIAEIVSSL